jgi:hypothetical protein
VCVLERDGASRFSVTSASKVVEFLGFCTDVRTRRERREETDESQRERESVCV